jgi:ParB family transcriptional regulator, chromosome partitioning protein
MQRDKKLGRGLGRLLGSGPAASPAPVMAPELAKAVDAPSRAVLKVDISAVDANPWQPRTDFPTTELEELMGSIREQGLLQPIVVRRRAQRYQLVAGERRLRACKELGWTAIDAIVIDATDQQMLEWAVIENLQRSALNAVETARSFRKLIDDFGLTQEEAARRLGQSRSHVANMLRILDLPGEILVHVSRGTIAPGAARALLSLGERDQQKTLAAKIVDEGLSVRAVEDAAKSRRRLEIPRRAPTSARRKRTSSKSGGPRSKSSAANSRERSGCTITRSASSSRWSPDSLRPKGP